MKCSLLCEVNKKRLPHILALPVPITYCRIHPVAALRRHVGNTHGFTGILSSRADTFFFFLFGFYDYMVSLFCTVGLITFLLQSTVGTVSFIQKTDGIHSTLSVGLPVLYDLSSVKNRHAAYSHLKDGPESQIFDRPILQISSNCTVAQDESLTCPTMPQFSTLCNRHLSGNISCTYFCC